LVEAFASIETLSTHGGASKKKRARILMTEQKKRPGSNPASQSNNPQPLVKEYSAIIL
jgi:hypothetical protein